MCLKVKVGRKSETQREQRDIIKSGPVWQGTGYAREQTGKKASRQVKELQLSPTSEVSKF